MSRFYVLLIALFFAASLFSARLQAAITVDGSLDDWSASNIVQDPIGDNAGSEAEMVRWGATIEGGYLYAFIEMDTPISTYASGTNDIWGGIYLNVDNQGGELGSGSVEDPSALKHPAGWLGEEWPGVFEGYDIAVEWGVNTGHWGGGYYVLGQNDNVEKVVGYVNDGAAAYTGNVMEYSCSVGELVTILAALPDNVAPASQWSIGACVEASINENGPWGTDNSDVIISTPEPSALISLLGVLFMILHIKHNYAKGV